MNTPNYYTDVPQRQTQVHEVGTNQIVCSGCRSLLVHPAGATNVMCALCNTITPVAQQIVRSENGSSSSHLICGGCRTMLMYPTGASSVRCAVCSTVNLLMQGSQVSNIRCDGCNTHLMYSTGATSVKCALCDHVTRVGIRQQQENMAALSPRMPPEHPSTSHDFQRQDSNPLIVVQNPSDEGQEAYNVAVGVKLK